MQDYILYHLQEPNWGGKVVGYLNTKALYQYVYIKVNVSEWN